MLHSQSHKYQAGGKDLPLPVLLLSFCPYSQGKQVTFFALRAHCWFSCKLLFTRPLRSPSVSLPASHPVPSPSFYTRLFTPMAIPCNAFAELCKIPVISFLQTAQVPLNGSFALQQLLPQACQSLTQGVGPQESPWGSAAPHRPAAASLDVPPKSRAPTCKGLQHQSVTGNLPCGVLRPPLHTLHTTAGKSEQRCCMSLLC